MISNDTKCFDSDQKSQWGLRKVNEEGNGFSKLRGCSPDVFIFNPEIFFKS